jgi:hypothetical protein
MSDHLKEIPPAAHLLGREIVSVDSLSGEVKLRFTPGYELPEACGIGAMIATARR